MAELYTYNATHLTTVRANTAEFTQCAELGQVGGGRFAIDDTAGTLAIVGQKNFSHTESACSFPLTYRGFIAERTYGRDAGTERAPHVGAGRGIGVVLEDLNTMLGFRGLTGATANRDAETVNERLTWLLAHDAVSGLFTGGSRVTTVTTDMDAADYRQQFPGDVLADLVLAAEGFNYYVADWGSGPELVFRDDNASTADTCTMRISNVLADASGVTVHPFKDAELRRNPSVVKSRLSYNYARGTYANSRAATATAFNGERYMAVSNSNIKTEAKAVSQVLSMLSQLSTEEDSIECTVLLTSAQVNLIRHGMRIEAKFSHLATEGYGSAFTWFRILERTVKPIVADGALYEVRLKLSPQEAGEEPDTCADLYDETPSDTYYALGGVNGAGAHPFASDGVVHYWRGGYTIPSVPDTYEIGSWHFGVWGAGGPATTDWAGDCSGNALILITVGNGEWTIQTEMYGGSPRALVVKLGTEYSTAVDIDFINSGDSVVVTIDDATDGDCVRSTVIKDRGLACGGKWGFSQAVWVAA